MLNGWLVIYLTEQPIVGLPEYCNICKAIINIITYGRVVYLFINEKHVQVTLKSAPRYFKEPFFFMALEVQRFFYTVIYLLPRTLCSINKTIQTFW